MEQIVKLVLGLISTQEAKIYVNETWINVVFRKKMPGQGWKLHISSNYDDLNKIVQISTPILSRFKQNFKVVRSTEILLNKINQDKTQVGKAITIYPESVEIAVGLSNALDQALKGFIAPKIPTDMRLYPESIVSYRYGSFGQSMVNDLNVHIEYLLDSRGRKQEDTKTISYTNVRWARNPFPETRHPPKDFVAITHNRYNVTKKLSIGPKEIYLVKYENGKHAIVKSAIQGMKNESGFYPTELLSNEFRILLGLDGLLGSPKAIELINGEDRDYLIKEAIEAESLFSYIRNQYFRACPLTDTETLEIIRQLSELVIGYHSKGLILGDLNPHNFIVDSKGKVHFIDFEYSHFFKEQWYMSKNNGFTIKLNWRDRSVVSKDLSELAGIILYVATGRIPYPKDCITPYKTRAEEYLSMQRPKIKSKVLKIITTLSKDADVYHELIRKNKQNNRSN